MKEQACAVQRMQDYIAEHYREEITLADLAKEAMFSPWYSYRLFIKYIRNSPADYIRKLRLTEAARLLKQEKSQITDVAFRLGFGSVDGFIRAFTREFGITPGVYRLKPIPVTFLYPITLSQEKI